MSESFGNLTSNHSSSESGVVITAAATAWRQSFISPTKLQELRASTPTHHFISSSQDIATMMAPNSDQAHPRPLRGPSQNEVQSHSRTSSFFSFNRNKDKDKAADLPMQRTPESEHSPPAPAPGPPPPSQPVPPPPLHPEIRSIVSLTVAHAHKIYFSGPLIRRIEREPNGFKPVKDMGWEEVWAQLGGTTLSIWNMKEIQEASKQGREVPPSYINMTDAFVQVLGSITVPDQPPRPAVPAKAGKPATATSPAIPPTPAQPATPAIPAQKYTNVLTLNTAGSNLLLFACPSTNALISWATALRLSAWEKSRLEEIYTAHLCRITLSARDVPTTLIRNRLEGWVQIRIAGQTDWKRVWMVVSAAASDTNALTPQISHTNGGTGTDELGRVVSNGANGGTSPPSSATSTTFAFTRGKKRMSSLFSRDSSNGDSNGHNAHPSVAGGPSRPMVFMYASPKPKDRKKPLLVMINVTQAFAVYPERPELISRSTLFKVEGTFSSDVAPPSGKDGLGDISGNMRGREGWILVMPQLEGGLSQAAEMLKWIIGFHDAFHLYGRPQAWTWDPRDPGSMMYAYPVGPHKDLLFLEREQAETLDPRDDRTSSIRSKLLDILGNRMQETSPPGGASTPGSRNGQQTSSSSSSAAGGSGPGAVSGGPPSLPPIGGSGGGLSGPQLPPLSFDHSSDHNSASFPEDRALLTPITERSSVYTKDGASIMLGTGAARNSILGPSPVPEDEEGESRRGLSSSPVPMMETNSTQTQTSPRLPEKDRDMHMRNSSMRSANSTLNSMNRGPTGSPAIGGRGSLDNFSNAVNTALPGSPANNLGGSSPSPANTFSSKPMSPVSGSGSISPSIGGNTNTTSGTGTPPPPPSPFVPLRSHSPQSSILTSPHSVDLNHAAGASSPLSDAKTGYGRLTGDRSSMLSTGPTGDRASVLTSPYSPVNSPAISVRTLNNPHPNSTTQASGLGSAGLGLEDSAGALYYMSQFDQQSNTTSAGNAALRRIPTTIQESESNGEGDDEGGSTDDLSNRYESAIVSTPTTPTVPAGASSPSLPNQTLASPVVRKGTPMAFIGDSANPNPESPHSSASVPAPSSAGITSSPKLSRFNPPLGRKPSGARAPARHGAVPEHGVANSYGYNPATTNQFSPSSSHQQPQYASAYSNPEENDEELDDDDDDDDLGSSIAPSNEQQPDQIPPRLRQQSSTTSSAVASIMASSPQQQHQQLYSTSDSTANSNNLHAGEDDVLAVLSYLDANDPEEESRFSNTTGGGGGSTAASSVVEPLHPHSNSSLQPTSGSDPYPVFKSSAAPSSGPSSTSNAPTYKSSFTPSKHAAERKAKAQATQAAQAAAAHRPGARSNTGPGGGQRKMRAVPKAGGWNESDSDEDDDEDDDEGDEEEVDSDAEPPSNKAKSSNSNSGKQGGENGYAAGGSPDQLGPHQEQDQGGQQYNNSRPSRTLPQIPGRGEGDEYSMPAPRRPDQPSRNTYFDDQQIRASQYNLPPNQTPGGSGNMGATRQSMWTQVLDASHASASAPETPATGRGGNDLFIQLEPHDTHMTKAFTPQGLLSAGMADRQDRSAKRQEELARESGASLINVPNKPPPPQTGLLGAVTAHERERKREGGIGAALTERERERRMAEERQRRWDEQQRVQMEQGGGMGNPMSMYGGMGMGGMNPMMSMYGMNPMMMGGLNPMMTGGMNPMMMGGMNPMMTGGGMNPMMPMMTGGGMAGYNPQQIFAAQQAAQAYQQAMMAFSVAGSQMGDDGPSNNKGSSPVGSPGGMNPMLSGNFDPRMSMMSMSGPTPAGMGMGGQMGQMGNMGMGPPGGMMGQQMTGSGGTPVSQFDARFSPSSNPTGNPMNDLGLLPPGSMGGGTNSPGRKGSPLARGAPSSRPATPKGS